MELTPTSLMGGTGKENYRTLALSPDGTKAAAAYFPRGAYKWEGASTYSKRLLTPEQIDSIDINNSGSVLLGYTSGTFSLWDEQGVEYVIGKIKGRITQIKFGLDQNEAILVYTNFVGTHLEKWNIQEKTKVRGYIDRNIPEIKFDLLRNNMVTSRYHTNGLGNNEYFLYDVSSLKWNSYGVDFEDSVFAFFGIEALGVLGNNKIVVGDDEVNVPRLLSASFYRDDTTLVMAARDKTMRFVSLEKKDPIKAFIWPFAYRAYEEVLFNQNGTKVLTWSEAQGLQLWDINSPPTASYEDVIESPAYKDIRLPAGRPQGRDHELDCTVSNNTITISNNTKMDVQSYQKIYYSVFDLEEELLSKGIYSNGLQRGASVELPIEENRRNTICEAAYYTPTPGGP